MKQATEQGGFAAQNSGSIIDCYSLAQVGGRGLTGGFAGVNGGTMQRCFSASRLKGLKGGFAGRQVGKMEHCYFFHGEKSGSAAIRKLHDAALAQRADDVDGVDEAAQLGFDFDEVWEFGGKKAPLMFRSENWMYDVSGSPLYEKRHDRAFVAINTAEELYRFAELVNAGKSNVRSAYVELRSDIDLGGKAWTPIGTDRTCAFSGLFDGGGHTVKNFKITPKQGDNSGFFGVLRGEVYNLSLDCRVKAGACAGAFAAQCEGGTIGCCSAVSDLSGKSGQLGGFVGVNSGTIFRCYCAGRVHSGLLLIPFFIANGALLLAISLLVLVPAVQRQEESGLPTYAPVPYDQDALPIPDDDLTPSTDGNFVSFQFEQEIDVNLTTGLCTFSFKNPGNSNHNTVVQLQFTDAQAVRVMGSTGRSAEEQQRLESDPAYDPETNRVILAESGAIPPGYELSDLRLRAQENGATVPEGVYNAMVYLVFYDINTNARAMLESQLPVVITVHE